MNRMISLDRIARMLATAPRVREARPIGLDLGAEGLHMLQLDGREQEPRIRAMLSTPYPADREATLASPPQLTSLLRQALKAGGFRGRRVVTAMPESGVRLMVLNYEIDRQTSEPERILQLVGERIDEALEGCVVDYLPIRTSGEKHGAKSALAVVARRDAVIDHLERLRAAGLEVEALEISPVAVRRLVARLLPDETDLNSLVVHCGARRSDLTVFSGRRLILYRELDFGEDETIGALGKSLEMSPEQARSLLYQYGVRADAEGRAWDDPAAAQEISETVLEILKPTFYALKEQVDKACVYTASGWRGASVDQVYLLGSIARWPGFDGVLQGFLSLPVRILEPLAAFAPVDGAEAAGRDRHREIAIAAGHALRGVDADG